MRRRCRLLVSLLAVLATIGIIAVPAGAEEPGPDAPTEESPTTPDAETGDEPAPAEDPDATSEPEPEPTPVLGHVDPRISDSIVRLYAAIFDRYPSITALDYWTGRYRSDAPLAGVAGAIMASAEGALTWGELDDRAYLNLLYARIFDRAPGERATEYWLAQLAAGKTRTEVLTFLTESAEFIDATNTTSPVSPPRLFPAVPAGSGEGTRIIYGVSAQRVWLVESDGMVHDSYPVSGKYRTPRAATYEVFSKSPKAWAAGDKGITMKWMVRYTWATEAPYLALGFHSIPRYPDGRPLQTEAQLGTYRSAGCTRQADDKAKKLYDWAPIGTKVVVLP